MSDVNYWRKAARDLEAERDRLRVYETLYKKEVAENARLREAGYSHTVHCDDADDLRAALEGSE